MPATINQLKEIPDLLRQNRPDEAQTLLRDLLAAEPDNPKVLHAAGLAALRCGRDLDAMALFHKAVAADPADPPDSVTMPIPTNTP